MKGSQVLFCVAPYCRRLGTLKPVLKKRYITTLKNISFFQIRYLMKLRFTLVFLALFFLSFESKAQVLQLTVANAVPEPGTTVTYHSTSTFDPGGDGPNQAWDFSSVTYAQQGTTENYKSVAPASTLPAGTNLVSIRGESLSGSQTYYIASPSLFSIVGGHSVQFQSSSNSNYTKNRDLLRFPMDYDSVFVNSWSSKSSVPGGITTSYSGVDTVKADAWGTLKTPAGTFTALRVKTSGTQYDTSSINGFVTQQSVARFVQYTWYSPTNGAVYSGFVRERTVNSITTNSEGGSFIKSAATGINPVSVAAPHWNLAPNPAFPNGRIQLFWGGPNNAKLTGCITNMLGHKVRTLNYTSTSSPYILETTGLPAGTYFISLMANGQPQGVQRVTLIY